MWWLELHQAVLCHGPDEGAGGTVVVALMLSQFVSPCMFPMFPSMSVLRHVPPWPYTSLSRTCPHACLSPTPLFLPQFQDFERNEQKPFHFRAETKRFMYPCRQRIHVLGGWEEPFLKGFPPNCLKNWKIESFAPVPPHLAVEDVCGPERIKMMELCWRRPPRLSSVVKATRRCKK